MGEQISDYIQQFDNEFESKKDWIKIHIELMFIEINDIKNVMYIFTVVENEWERKSKNGDKVGHSALRTLLFESLPYRIVLGLSKIFYGSPEYSLKKTINKIEQMDEYKNNEEVKAVIGQIKCYLQNSTVVKLVTMYRDKFFAHLDKECVLSDLRIDSTVAINRLEQQEINKCIELLASLHRVCFGSDLEYANHELSEDDIIDVFFGIPMQV